jgi:hypothetical protein
MERQNDINVAAKQRLRESISEQIKRYLAQGGKVTVLEPPRSEAAERGAYRGSAWHGHSDQSPLFD